MKYYAVAVGRKTGVFTDWDEVKGYVNGFKGAKYAAFPRSDYAEKYVASGGSKDFITPPEVSFVKNLKTLGRVYSQAKRDDKEGKLIVHGFIDSPSCSKEVIAWTWLEDMPCDLSDVDMSCYAYVHVIKVAYEMGIRDISIVYKNDCLKGWGETWKARSDSAKYYKSCIQFLRSRCNIYFEKYDKGVHYHMEYNSQISLPFKYTSEQYQQFGYTGVL